MYYNPVYYIKIGNYRFRSIISLEIFKSTNQIGNRATIVLPISAVIRNNGKKAGSVMTAQAFNINDEVIINCGYRGELVKEEFRGKVKSIRHESPVVIECLDNMIELEQYNYKKTFPNSITLKRLLGAVLEPFKWLKLDSSNIPELTFKFYYLVGSGRYILEELQRNFGFDIWFEGDVLRVVLPYLRNAGSKVLLYLSGEKCNVAEVTELKFRDAKSIKLKVKAILMKSDGTKITKEVGDEGGNEITLYFYSLPEGTNLKDYAWSQRQKYVYDGYDGTIKTFFIPDIQPGMTAILRDPKFSREGSYFIESVIISGDSSGLFRKVKIGIKI